MAEYDETLLAKAAEALYANACEPTGTKARVVLDTVAPLIAAQALREAAEQCRRDAEDGHCQSPTCAENNRITAAWLDGRADRIAPDPTRNCATGATANSEHESGPEGHRDHERPATGESGEEA